MIEEKGMFLAYDLMLRSDKKISAHTELYPPLEQRSNAHRIVATDSMDRKERQSGDASEHRLLLLLWRQYAPSGETNETS